jgi:polar amino acid transport system permease protein
VARSRALAQLREEGAKAAIIAAVSTVAFVGLATALVVTSDAWPKVRAQYFSWEDAREVWPAVWKGFQRNVWMFVVAEFAILALSLLLAVVRSLRGPAFFPIRTLAIIFIDLLRGLPLYLVLILLGFGVPALQIDGVPSSPWFWGVTALVLSYSAYTAEVFRAGMDSVHESQRAAGRSLGLTQFQTLWYAVIPQAVRNTIPALLGGLISLQKDVALVSVLGIREAIREADIYKSRTFNYTGFVVAAVLFLIISVPLARFTDWYTARDRRRRQQQVA